MQMVEVVPVEEIDAWETEIPRHDFTGYMKIDLTFAAAASSSMISAIIFFFLLCYIHGPIIKIQEPICNRFLSLSKREIPRRKLNGTDFALMGCDSSLFAEILTKIVFIVTVCQLMKTRIFIFSMCSILGSSYLIWTTSNWHLISFTIIEWLTMNIETNWFIFTV